MTYGEQSASNGTGMYSFGHLTWPKDTDPRFEDEAEAISAAEQASRDSTSGLVYGVWNDDTGELLHIVFEGMTFSS